VPFIHTVLLLERVVTNSQSHKPWRNKASQTHHCIAISHRIVAIQSIDHILFTGLLTRSATKATHNATLRKDKRKRERRLEKAAKMRLTKSMRTGLSPLDAFQVPSTRRPWALGKSPRGLPLPEPRDYATKEVQAFERKLPNGINQEYIDVRCNHSASSVRMLGLLPLWRNL
jgi:hypothetical protein